MKGPIALVPGRYYHLYNRGNNGENLFRETRNYHYFLELYAARVEPVAETYAYCLLKNHFHLLVRIKDAPGQVVAPGPSQAFSNLFNAYTKAINKTYERTGSLFQKPFQRLEVAAERYFLQLIFISTSTHKNTASSPISVSGPGRHITRCRACSPRG